MIFLKYKYYCRIEKKIVIEVGEIINDTEVPTLVTNVLPFSQLSVSTF